MIKKRILETHYLSPHLAKLAVGISIKMPNIAWIVNRYAFNLLETPVWQPRQAHLYSKGL